MFPFIITPDLKNTAKLLKNCFFLSNFRWIWMGMDRMGCQKSVDLPYFSRLVVEKMTPGFCWLEFSL